MLHLLGRFHLLLLHLPIGILLFAGALAAWSRWRGQAAYHPALHLTLALGAVSAAVSAGCGWLLARDGSYDSVLLERHQWLGFAAAALAVATWLLRDSRWQGLALWATLGAVTLAGHFGGSLTHGEGYLLAVVGPQTAVFGEKNAGFPPVAAENADPDALTELRQAHIAVQMLGQQVPWLAVSVAGKKDLNPVAWALLRKVSQQVVHLDASHSNLDDALLAELKNLPNLTRLSVARTAVSAAGLQSLAGLEYLEHLNLSGTAVGDEAADVLAKMPRLRTLFVWNSHFSPDGVERLRALRPDLRVEVGPAPSADTTRLQLRPPKILFARNIFHDTVQVALDFPFKSVALFYTVNAASPTSQSVRYAPGQALVFDSSVTLRAVAVRDGWADSPVAEASFVKSRWKPRSVTLAAPPSTKYPGEGGAKSLYDGKIGTDIADQNFLGYEGEHLTAVLDFGEAIDFQRLSVHYGENNGSWVFAPAGLRAWVSDDAQKWSPCIQARYPAPSSTRENRAAVLSERLPAPQHARYLKVQVENLLRNPAWHPGAGKKCWVFVDEILVE